AALLLDQLGQEGEGKDVYRKHAEALYRAYVAESKKPERFLVLGEFLARTGRAAEALDACEKALGEKAPPEAAAAVMTATVRAGDGAPLAPAVERKLQELAMKNPDAPGLQIYLADLRDFQGRYDEAKALYLQVLQKRKTNVLAMNNLACLLALKEGK